MRLLRYLAVAFALTTGPAAAQDGAVFLDVERALRDMQNGGETAQDFFEKYEDLLARGDNFNIVVNDLELIRRTDIPVELNVSGDWGNYTARCNMTFQFVRRPQLYGFFHVEGAVWGSSLEFAYSYSGDTPPYRITRHENDYDEGSFGEYAAGDFLTGQNCELGGPNAPDYAENPRITELNAAQLACADALVPLVLTNPNGPPPPECLKSTALLINMGESIGAGPDMIAMFERCIPEQAIASTGGPEISTDCALNLKQYANRVENALGLCDMSEIPTVALAVIDPRPESFKARYNYSYQRSDCKTLNVSAYIKAPPPALFALTDMAPAPDECLSVEYVAPRFRVTFSDPIREEGLASKVRLQLSENANLSEIPVDVVLSAPNQIDIAPQQNLLPETRYILSLKTGFKGLRSTDNAELEIGTGVVDSTSLARDSFTQDFEPVTWFQTTPFSDFDPAEPALSVRGAVYQVSRDADLIRNRPTATRIWLDWTARSEQVLGGPSKFCAQFQVRDWESDVLLYDPVVKTMKPTDAYTDDERLFSEDTANLFNWRPSPDTAQLFITAEPSQYWHAPDSATEPPFISALHDVRVLDDAPVTLTMKYGYLRTADFEDGVGDYETGLMARHMQAARQYTWQMGPYGRVSVENLGSVTPEALGIEVPWGIEDTTAATANTYWECVRAFTLLLQWGNRCESFYVLRAKQAVAMFRLAAAAFAGQHCKGDSNTVCFLFVPPYLGTHNDVSTRQTGRGVMVSTSVLGLTSDFMPPSEKTTAQRNRYIGNGGDLAHEIGHSFGLYHVPLRDNPGVPNFWETSVPEDFQAYEDDGGRFRGIDGIRMHPSGTQGIFKSSAHGNPETPSLLAPLMFPNVLPAGATQILDIHYRLWLLRVGSSSPVYSLGDPRFTDPDPNDASKRVGPLGVNNTNYTDMRGQILSSNIAIFDDLHAGEIEGDTRPIGYDPSTMQGEVDGIITTFVSLQDDAGNAVFALHRPTRATRKPIPSDGTQFMLTALSDQRVLGDIAFVLDGGTEQELSVFLPLSADQMQALTQVVLRDATGTAIVTYDVAPLPKTESASLSETPDGLTVLEWDSADTAASLIVSFEHQQDGQTVTRSIGSSTDTGRFAFDPAMTGIVGSGIFRLTFDSGIATKTIRLPATLDAPFATISTGHSGPWDTPEFMINFNRDLAADLPAFTLMRDDTATDIQLAAAAVDDTLFLTPQIPLAPCTTYAIRSQTPLQDGMGNAMRIGSEWTLSVDNATGDCPQPQSASLIMRRDTREQTSAGSVELKDDAIVLSFDRQIVVLAPESLRPGTYDLSSVARGDTRQSVVLNYIGPNPGPSKSTDQLTLTQDGPALTGAFAATLSGGRMEGHFLIVQD